MLVGRLVSRDSHKLLLQYDEPRGRKKIAVRRSDVAFVHTVVTTCRSELRERQPAAS